MKLSPNMGSPMIIQGIGSVLRYDEW